MSIFKNTHQKEITTMQIELKKVTVRDLTQGYEDNEELGVRGYNGQLDIRPQYQREFIYDEKKRAAVITLNSATLLQI